ncbi:MAG: secondary thiamine-phosphate synthase enzyme YjbQ [Bacillota bacterium]|jgi:secondary thiamine-phosphate synthase enzyme
MVHKFTLQTAREGFHDITSKVREAVGESGITDGICIVYCPHTTAGITINENADPDVVTDMLYGLGKTCPHHPEYRHIEGNTTAHMKASIIGSSVTVIIENGRLLLGRWQGIYFCEFDGPRTRSCYVKVIPG